MASGPESFSAAEPAFAGAAEHIVSVPERVSFFQRVDWLAFGLTIVIVLTVYLFTLAPEVTLESSGIYATSANYAGIAYPPGLPFWTLYAWLFTKLLPFSNIACRIAVSSAVAGALACGIIALVVSRGGAMILEGMDGFRRLRIEEENRLRVIAGLVAGTAFGFHRFFWGRAVIVEPTALTILLLATVFCLLLRWIYSPEQNRWLYAAFLVYGLTLSAELWVAVAIPGLPFVVLFRKPSLGRDLFFAIGAIVALEVLAARLGFFPAILGDFATRFGIHFAYLVFGIFAALVCATMTVITRRLLTHW